MVRHAARALPWPLLAAAAVLLYGLLRTVQEWPYAGVAAPGAGRRAAGRDGCVRVRRAGRRRGRHPAARVGLADRGPQPGCGPPAGLVARGRGAHPGRLLRPRHGDRLAGTRGDGRRRRDHRTPAPPRRGRPGHPRRHRRGRRCHVPGAGAAVREPAADLPLPRGRPVVRQPHAVDRRPRGHHGLAGRDAARCQLRSWRRPPGCRRRRRGRGRPRSRRTPGPRPRARPRRGRAGRRCRP